MTYMHVIAEIPKTQIVKDAREYPSIHRPGFQVLHMNLCMESSKLQILTLIYSPYKCHISTSTEYACTNIRSA